MYSHNKDITSGTTHLFVHGYPKYVIDAHERLRMVLLERQGSRRLELLVK